MPSSGCSTPLFIVLTYVLARKAPRFMQVGDPPRRHPAPARRLSASTSHFKPVYNPWDQRLCLILDYDLYKAISDGRVDVVTDHIDHFDATAASC